MLPLRGEGGRFDMRLFQTPFDSRAETLAEEGRMKQVLAVALLYNISLLHQGSCQRRVLLPF